VSQRRSDEPHHGFQWKAAPRKKLLDCDSIPFGEDAWQVALGLYQRLRPAVTVIAGLLEVYIARGAFSEPIASSKPHK
jgi:hypothetical protein